jgi:hypothetical protein
VLGCLLVLALLSGPWAHAAPAGVTERFLAAAREFETARAGSPEATPLAQAAFHDLLASDPANPLYLAYYGSTLALQARDSRLPWQRLNLVRECISTLDRAVSLLKPADDQRRVRDVPVSLETRLVAVATYVALPEIFHRLPVAKQQLALAMGSPPFAGASSELRGRFYYEVALVAQAEGQADNERAALRQVLQLAPASLDLKEVRARLARLDGQSAPAVAIGR